MFPKTFFLARSNELSAEADRLSAFPATLDCDEATLFGAASLAIEDAGTLTPRLTRDFFTQPEPIGMLNSLYVSSMLSSA